MRNLKRALSLTLASVMLLGMMVVGSSAAAGYDDVADTDNVEAIEVAQAVGIMIGDENDNFRPGDPVSRAEMAVVMGKLLSLDYNYYEATCPFTDVSGVYDWARGWVGACYANGIVSGRGEGIYDPGATVTAVETASMLMRALGYFKYQSDYANGFEVATVSQATKINLFDGVNSKTNEPLTRNQVAQMVLNALKSGTVEPDGNALNFVDVNGNVIATGGKVNYVFVTSNKAFAQAISSVRATAMGSANDSPIVELGERLFNGDLKLYDPTSDDFERPSRTWEYKGLEVGTYMKVENIKETYTAGVNIRTLYDLLGRSSLQEYTVSRYVDGVLADTTENAANTILSRQDKDLAYTGRGVLTQVFVDTTEKTIDITSINTYLAQATTDYNKNNESAMLEIFTVAKEDKVNGIVVSAETKSAVKTVDQADVPEIVDVAKDTYYLVNVTGKYMNASASDLDVKSNTDLSRFEVAVIDNVEIMSDATLTKFSKNSDQDTQSNQNEAFFKSLVTGGTEYKSSARAAYSDEVLDLYAENLLVDKTYNVFLDDYGYAIGVDLYSGNNNYVFITGFDPSGSYITLGTATAAAIFTDGTMSTIKVNVKDTNKNIDKVDEVAGTYFEKWHAQEEQKTSPSETGMFSSKATVNRWYTYTVNSAGEYVLNPATRMITTEVTAKDEVIKCNSVRIDENPARMYDNGWAAYDFKNKVYVNGDTRTYGNDDSIFIVVDIDEKADLSDGRIINDVSGVYTGVQNVEINVKNKEKAATWGADGKTYITTSETGTEKTALYDSIYTLYDKNNYIIASVIIGDAKGGNANYAYILSAAKSEERLSDGTTLWTFDAIVDGKITTLTTSDKFTKVINQLEPGHIQELRYTGDYVTGVKTPENDNFENYYGTAKAFTKGDGGKTTNAGVRITDEGIYDVGHDFNAVSYHDNDCAQTASEHIANITDDGHLATINGKWVAADLRVIGRTMYLNRTESLGALGADYGLTFVQDAPAVVLHKVDGDWKELEFSSVAQAVSELGDADPDVDGKQFAGRVVAPLNDQGVAKWIVFISDTEITTHGAGSVTRNAEIKFNMGDYPVDRYSFYVNGKRVTEDEIVPTGSGLVSFRAPVGASVNLVKLPGTTEFEGKNGDEWVIGSNETVIGYISDEGGTMNFTAVNTTLKSRGNYVPSVRYSLTIDKAITGGTVTSDPAEGSYVSGTQVTLTITPAEGNELKTLTVGGASVDVTSVKDDKYTFNLSANTTVSATFGKKATEPTEDYTLNIASDFTDANSLITVDGEAVKNGDKVSKDVIDTLDIQPDKSIAVITVDDDKGEVKIEKSEFYTCLPYIGDSVMWMGSDENGNIKPFVFTPAGGQSRMRIQTRAASNDPTEWEDGDSDTLGIVMFFQAGTDVNAAYTITCPGKVGSTDATFTWTKAAGENTWVFSNPDNDPAYVEGARRAISGNMFLGGATLTKGSETPVDPDEPQKMAPHTYDVEAIIGSDGKTLTFRAHFDPDGNGERELNEEEIAQAMTNLGHTTLPSGVDLDANTVTTVDPEIEYSLVSSDGLTYMLDRTKAPNLANELFMVTWPGCETPLYLRKGVALGTGIEMTKITDGVTYLIPDDVLQGTAYSGNYGAAATAVITVASKTASKGNYVTLSSTAQITKDINYVEAVPVGTNIVTGTGNVMQGTFWTDPGATDKRTWILSLSLRAAGAGKSVSPTDVANWNGQTYVPKGTEIVLQQTRDSANTWDSYTKWQADQITSLILTVNGEKIELPVNKETKAIDLSCFDDEPLTVESVWALSTATPKAFTMSLSPADPAKTVVRLNGNVINVDADTVDATTDMDYYVGTGDKELSIVYYDKAQRDYARLGVAAANTHGYTSITSALVQAQKGNAVGGVLDFYTAYTVAGAQAAGSGSMWTSYEVYNSDADKYPIGNNTAVKYYLADPEEDEFDTVYIEAATPNTQLVWTDATGKYDDSNMNEVVAPGLEESDSTLGVWEVAVNRNIGASTFARGIMLNYTSPATGNVVKDGKVVVVNARGAGSTNTGINDTTTNGVEIKGLQICSKDAIESVVFTLDDSLTTKTIQYTDDPDDVTGRTPTGSSGFVYPQICFWANGAWNYISASDMGTEPVGRLTITLKNGWDIEATVYLNPLS